MTVRDFSVGAEIEQRIPRSIEGVRTCLEFAISVVIVVLLLPVFAVVALIVRFTGRGPVLFSQERVGKDLRPFTIYKFRTMQVDNDDTAHRAYVKALLTDEVAPHGGVDGVYKLASDPRVTPAGAFLRRTSLDELPQLFNVLRGDMSLVGPRPALPWEAELFPAGTELRFTVRPGITGVWQVGGRGGVDMRTALQMDLEYVRTRSLRGDLRILLRTVVVLFGRSVTR